MAGMQAPTAEDGFELTALSTGGESTSEEPWETNQSASIIEIAQSRPSLSDLYEIENADICTAAIRTVPRESASDRLRLRVREIKSNKIARRTLQVTIVIGALTVLYQFISLFPAFQNWHAASRALQVQIQGEADSRQSLVYEFLTFCENRKNQNLSLGPDCEKYLGAYPKAPPGIEKLILPRLPYADFYPDLPPQVIGAGITQGGVPGVTSMLDPRLLELLKYGFSALEFSAALQPMSARHRVLVCITAGILLTPVFVWIVVPVSKVEQFVTNVGVISLFAIVFYLANGGGLAELIMGTAAYVTIFNSVAGKIRV